MPGTRKLGRTSDSRNAMMRAMVTYLLENGKIETTVTRAKDVRSTDNTQHLPLPPCDCSDQAP